MSEYTKCPEIVREARRHALDQFPNEAVGCVIMGRYIRLENCAEEPEWQFRVADFPSDAVALIHSHTKNQPLCPFRADMESQQAMALPWGILNCDGKFCSEIQWFGDQLPVPPLLGRTFVSGWTDCWCLVRDVYRTQFGIVLQNIPRDDDWYKSTEDRGPLDLLGLDRIIETGFRVISRHDARPGDVLLGRVHSEVINHCGILVGNNLLLHQLEGDNHLSRRETVNNWWRLVQYVVRHESFMDEGDSVVLPAIDFRK